MTASVVCEYRFDFRTLVAAAWASFGAVVAVGGVAGTCEGAWAVAVALGAGGVAGTGVAGAGGVLGDGGGGDAGACANDPSPAQQDHQDLA
jgi:hypothetical protein